MAPLFRGHIEIFADATMKGPHPSRTPSFIFKKGQRDGSEAMFGAALDLLDRDSIFDGQSSAVVLHCWRPEPRQLVSPGDELVVWYAQDIGTLRIDEVLPDAAPGP